MMTPSVMGSVKEVILTKGEVFVASVDMTCNEIQLSPQAAPVLTQTVSTVSMESFNAGGGDTNTGELLISTETYSPGDLYVDWRVDDDSMLSCFDLSNYTVTQTKNERGTGSSTGVIDAIAVADHLQKDNTTTESCPFSWLLQWGPGVWTSSQEEAIDHMREALDTNVGTTRVCGMVFSVPRVLVADAPFDVTIDVAHTCAKDTILPLIITVKNKRWSPEHLSLTVVPTHRGYIAGNSTSTQTQSELPMSAVGSGGGGVSTAGSNADSGFIVIGSTKSLLDVSHTMSCILLLILILYI